MATLTGTKIKDTYDGLLKVSDNVGLNSTKKIITDGLGNNSSVKISTSDFEVGGFFYVDIDGNLPDSKIGIGTNAPTETLHVVGNFRLTARFFDGSNSAGLSGRVLMSTGSATSWSNTFSSAMTFNAGVIINAGIKDYVGSTGTAGQVLSSTGSADVEWVSLSEIQGVDGSGTANYIPIWTDSDTLGNSVIYQLSSNIGIGTLSPGSYKLNVFGEFKLNSNGSGYMQSDYGDHKISIYDGSNNEVIIFQDLDGSSANQLVVASSGVGIGTNAPATMLNISSTSFNDHITLTRSTDELGITVSGGQILVEGGLSPFSNVNEDLGRTDKHWNEAFVYSIRSGGALQFKSNGNNERMRITSTGEVGVGTTSPSSGLHLSGGDNTKSKFTLTNTAPLIDNSWSINPTNGTNLSLNQGISNRVTFIGGGQLQLSAYGSGTFTGTATQRLAVDNSGNIIEVPIGSGAVDGSGTANTVTMWSDADTLTDAPITISSNDATFTGGIQVSESAAIHGTDNQTAAIFMSTGGLKGRFASTYARNLISSNGSSTITIGDITSLIDSIQLKAGSSAVNGVIQFLTKATERMRIASNGNVGIGTTTPTNFGTGSHLITVQSASGGGYGGFIAKTDNVTGQLWANEGGSNVYLGTRSNHPLILTINNLEKARIDSAGDMTINGGRLYVKESDLGNTAVAITRDADEGYLQLFSSGTQTVELRGNGNSYFTGNLGIGTTSPSHLLSIGTSGNASGKKLTFYLGSSDGNYAGIGAQRGETNLYCSSEIRFINESNSSGSGAMSFNTGLNSLNERMRITSAGNVGVGASDPLRKLHVVGNMAVNAGTDEYYGILMTGGESADPKITIGDWHNSSATIKWDSTGNYLRIDSQHNTANSSIVFSGNDATTEYMRINSSGYVGIGTTSPDVKLEIVEASPTNGIVADFVNSTNAGGTTAAIKLSNADSDVCDVVLGANRVLANFGSDFFISLSDNVDGTNQERLRITEDGKIKFNTYGSGTFTGTATYKLAVDSSGNIIEIPIGSGAVDGSGTASTVTMWSDADTLTDAPITISGNNATFAGNISLNDSGELQLGTGNDSQIYNNGSHLFIDNGTGNSYLRNTSTGSIILRNSTGGDIQFDNEFAGNILFNTSNIERMRVTSDGYVIHKGPTGAGTNLQESWYYGTDSNYRLDLKQIVSSGLVKHSFNIVNNGVGYDNNLVLDRGNVGIGTASPQSGGGSASWLSLNGTAAYSGGIVYTISSTTKAYSYFESDYLKQQAQSGFGQKFIVDGTNTAMTILNSGNVGIGTTLPNEKLTVSGNIESLDTFILNYGNNGNKWQQLFDGANGWNLRYYNGSSWSSNFININTSGNASFTGNITLPQNKYIYFDNTAHYIRRGSSNVEIQGYNGISLRTNGSTRLLITQTGEVGIGTTSPNSYYANANNLVVGSHTGSNGISILSASDQTGWLVFADSSMSGGDSTRGAVAYNHDNNSMTLRVNNAGLMTLKDSKVGIGTTNPTQTLDVDGAIITEDYRSASTFYLTSGDDWRFRTDTGSERMRITSGGNVGIGITSPVSNLHVKTSVDNNVAQGLVIERSANSDRGYINYNGGGFQFRSTVGDPIVFGETDSEHLRISPDGKVGIGTTTPAFKTTIYSSGTTDSFPLVVGQGNAANEFVGIGLSGFIASNGAVKAAMVLDRDGIYGVGDIHFLNNTTQNNTNATLSDSRLVIKKSNNVGIGTTSPYGKLHLNGNDSQNIILTNSGADGNTSTTISRIIGQARGYSNNLSVMQSIDFVTNNSTWYKGEIVFKTNNTDGTDISVAASERMRINSSGDVGIGTLPHTAGNTWRTLYVGSSATIISRQAASGTDVIFSNNFYINDSNVDKRITTGGASRMFINQDVMRFQRATSGSTDTTISWSESMRIDSSGNVGVGTTSPFAKLDVVDSSGAQLQVSGWSDSNGANNANGTLYIGNTASYRGVIDYDAASTGSLIISNTWNNDNGNIIFKTKTQGTDVIPLTLKGSGDATFAGNVGIGTSTPDRKLEVDFTNSTYGLKLTRSDATGSSLIELANSAGVKSVIGYDAGTDGFKIGGLLSTRLLVKNDGNVGIGNTNPSRKLAVSSSGVIADFISSITSSYVDIIGTTAQLRSGVFGGVVGIANGTGTTAHLAIDSSGNVGIGTTSPFGATANRTAFSVNGTNDVTLNIGTGGTQRGYMYSDGTQTRVATVGAIPLTLGVNDAEKMRITSAGNVGIGTTSPTEKLHVSGVIKNTGFLITESTSVHIGKGQSNSENSIQIGLNRTSNGYAYIDFIGDETYTDYGFRIIRGNTGANTDSQIIHRGTGDFIIKNNEAAHLKFLTTNSERMRITSAGSVGIGTTSPVTKLDVYGTSDTYLTVRNSGAGNKAGIRMYGGSAGISHIWHDDTETNPPGIHFGTSADTAATPTTQLYIKGSNGNVGIGTSSPSEKLEVSGSNTLSIKLSRNNTDATYVTTLTNNYSSSLGTELKSGIYNILTHGNSTGTALNFTNGAMTFDFRNSEYMRITSAGDVGIGTTGPQALLDVRKDIATIYDPLEDSGQRSGTATIHITNQDTTVGSFGQIMYDSDGTNQGIARIVFVDSGTASVDTAFVNEHSNTKAERMRITSAGNVGIGTSSPSEKLHVAGDITIDNSNPILNLLSGINGNSTINFGDPADNNPGQIIYRHNGNSMSFDTSDNERMRIDMNGNVGINTTSPGVKLDVIHSDTGSTYSDGVARFHNNTTSMMGGSAVLNVRNSYNAGFGGLIKFWTASIMSSVGNISFNSDRTAVNYNTTSDYRLKEDYKDFDGLDITSKIKVYDFKWKNKDHRSYGVIAHELNDVVPSAVTGEKDGQDMQAVDYSKLVPLLLKSVQELKEENFALKARVSALEKN